MSAWAPFSSDKAYGPKVRHLLLDSVHTSEMNCHKLNGINFSVLFSPFYYPL